MADAFPTAAPAPPAADEVRSDVVVVGASAGGLEALRELMAALPGDYDGSVFVVMHLAPERVSVLPQILDRAGALPVRAAEDAAPMVPGHVYVAPADRHLLLERDRMRVVRGPRENRSRPAIDPLFRSAAWVYGPRVAGVLLSGALDDGTAGLWAIRVCGGVTIVQEPAEAANPEMPRNALIYNRIDHRLPVAQIAERLVELSHGRRGLRLRPAPPAAIGDEVGFGLLARGLAQGPPPGAPSVFTCPTCGGALWEMEEGGHLRYRCHTGHAFGAASLVVEQGSAIEHDLYVALRAVEQKAAALRRLAEGAQADVAPTLRIDYEARANELDAAGSLLRRLLAGLPP